MIHPSWVSHVATTNQTWTLSLSSKIFSLLPKLIPNIPSVCSPLSVYKTLPPPRFQVIIESQNQTNYYV